MTSLKNKIISQEESPATAHVMSKNWDEQRYILPNPSTDAVEEVYGLHKKLMLGIISYGYEHASSTQMQCLPTALNAVKNADGQYEYVDGIYQAPSGTGKTAVFCISALQIIINMCGPAKPNCPHCIMVSPVKELARQTYDRLLAFGQYMDINIILCCGGESVRHNKEALKRGVDIVVGTPGRIKQLIDDGYMNGSELVNITLDEADRRLGEDEGFHEQLGTLFGPQHNVSPQCQYSLFSSTFSRQVLESIQQNSSGGGFLRPNANHILLNNDEVPLEGIQQYLLKVDEKFKDDVLMDVFGILSMSQTIIFTNSKKCCENVKEKLTEDKFPCEMLKGDQTDDERKDIFKRFQNGDIRVLITTDVFSRGIDVQGVSYVINYELPRESETYIQRIGRAGRFGRKGVAINFVSNEYDKERLKQIESKYPIKIEEMPQDFSI